MSVGVILALIAAAKELIAYIAKLRKNNAMTAGWTDAERAQVDAEWTALSSSPHWQTDADRGGG